MTLSRKKLYAAGEPFGPCATQRKPGGRIYGGGGGGGGSTHSESNPVTTNTDKRVAVSGGLGLSGDGSQISTSSTSTSTFIDNSNSSDAIIAMTDAGANIIKSSGAAVVDLARFQGEQNTEAWNNTLTTGASLIDKLIGQAADGMKLSSKVVDSFTPTENAQNKTMQYGMIAAAVVAGAVLLKGSK